MRPHTHNTIRENMLSRIQSGEWALGDKIPVETSLAQEYGCARATVNRALQSLADQGLLIRKRKGGTRVCKLPVRYAKFEIPVIREHVEALGSVYHHKILDMKLSSSTASIRERLRLDTKDKVLRVDTLHMADGHAFAYEERWINIAAVPAILNAPLEQISANEWLVKEVPFSNGDVIFSAIGADKTTAKALETHIGTALFTVERTTWSLDEFITTMKLYYKEGYQLRSRL
ncbi:MAG: UTRA domain-containing protein [Litorimonas sp.]